MIDEDKLGFVDGFELFLYQAECAEKLIDSLNLIGQAGLEAFTCAGKSYIGMTVAADYLTRFSKKKVLWISNKSANDNVSVQIKNVLKKNIYNRITFINYETLARLNGKSLPRDVTSGTGLIIFDECHMALAEKTYMAVQRLLLRYTSARILAMTATEVRPSDNISSLKSLVPLAYNNKHIVNASMQYAIRNNLINDISYTIVANNFSNIDLETLRRMKKMAYEFSDTRKEYDALEKEINNYNSDKIDKVYEALHFRIGGKGKSFCDRHIVFYSNIKNLLNDKDHIREVFSRLYPDCNIRVWEYHSEHKNNEDTLKNAIHGEPIPGNIDIILTVNKGVQSIHPKNMKSIIMFRNTKSNIVFTQQIGRVVSLKNISNISTLVFDFCSNINMLGNMTIGIGVKPIEDRRKSDDIIITFEELKDMIRKAIGDTLNISFLDGTPRMLSCITGFRALSRTCKSRTLPSILLKLKNRYKDDVYVKACPNYSSIITAYQFDPDPNKPRYDEKTLKDVEYYCDRLYTSLVNRTMSKGAIFYDAVVQDLGHTLYFEPLGEFPDAERNMLLIDKISDSLNMGYTIDNLPDNIKLIHKNLVKKACSREISTNVCAYAYTKGVELNASNIDNLKISIWKKSLSPDNYKSLMSIDHRFKDYKNINPKDEKRFNCWVSLRAAIYVYKAIYISRQAIDAINNLIDDNIEIYNEFNDKMLKTDRDYIFIAVMCQKIKNSKSVVTGTYQDNLFEHECSIDKYTKIEQSIFKLSGFNKTTHNKKYFFLRTNWGNEIVDSINTNNAGKLSYLINEGLSSSHKFRVAVANRLKNKYI